MSADYTPAQIMAGISSAMGENDMPAVVSLLKMLAAKDPDSAQAILDMIELTR